MMRLNYYKSVKLLLFIIDLFSMAFSFLIAASMVISEVDGVSFSQFLSMRIRIINFVLFIIFGAIWYTVLSLSGAYYIRRLSHVKEEIKSILHGTSIGTLLLLGFGMIFSIKLVTPFFLIVFWVLTSSIAIFNRIFVKSIMVRLWVKGINLQSAVMVGSNVRAVRFAKNLASSPELGYRVLGFVDQDWPGNREFQESGYPLLADFKTFPSFLRTHVVDEVIIDLPLNTFYQEASYIVGLCVQQGIIVRFLSDSFYLLFDMSLARTELETVQNHVVISVYTGAMGGWPIIAKRVFDFLVSLGLIILLSPLFLLVAALIKLTSPGKPVFFLQDRIGLRKRIFKVIKFRTMIPDAEHWLTALEGLNEASGPVFKIKDDPRITFLGRFLRRTSIDELPQLFNVLMGDMSLVGPRPLPVRDYEGFNQDWHRRRFSVKPGITCLWQIYGRSSLSRSFEKWMQLDMEYIDHWSLGLDLKILARTIPAVLKGREAY
jgi:exopolysaccharide biosynthesis polyprenyl glycosylphosphotransferase